MIERVSICKDLDWVRVRFFDAKEKEWKCRAAWTGRKWRQEGREHLRSEIMCRQHVCTFSWFSGFLIFDPMSEKVRHKAQDTKLKSILYFWRREMLSYKLSSFYLLCKHQRENHVTLHSLGFIPFLFFILICWHSDLRSVFTRFVTSISSEPASRCWDFSRLA